MPLETATAVWRRRDRPLPMRQRRSMPPAVLRLFRRRRRLRWLEEVNILTTIPGIQMEKLGEEEGAGEGRGADPISQFWGLRPPSGSGTADPTKMFRRRNRQSGSRTTCSMAQTPSVHQQACSGSKIAIYSVIGWCEGRQTINRRIFNHRKFLNRFNMIVSNFQQQKTVKFSFIVYSIQLPCINFFFWFYTKKYIFIQHITYYKKTKLFSKLIIKELRCYF